MLDKKKIKYTYRDYTEDPLSAKELGAVIKKLGVEPKQLLRKGDKAYKENKLTGNESPAKLIELMAKHPTLLQRPIGIAGRKAVLGRPIEKLLDLK